MLQGLEIFEFSGFQHFNVIGLQGYRVTKFKGSELQGYRVSLFEVFEISGFQRYDNVIGFIILHGNRV